MFNIESAPRVMAVIAVLGLGMILAGVAMSVGLKREEAEPPPDFICYMDGEVTRTARHTELILVTNLGQASEVWEVTLEDGETVKIMPFPGEQCGRS